MEDDEYDNNSKIGKLIQRINKLCKKPQIDLELSNALDVFQKQVTQQETYLENGVFSINFAEAALFLQSCTELYGKKVDLFWDQLLEFHTRLIEYECQDQKEKGKKLNTDAIQQLEERRNRYKRKKKFKLTMAEDNSNMEDFLFDKPSSGENEEVLAAFEADDELYKAWRRIECETGEITKIPRAIVKQQRRMYRMKNYYIMKNQDWDIFDSEDGEFNTKYSRIPGWHMIHHIFEYNTLGLLPDKNNTIATLRLSCYLRAQFMRDRKIPFNAPYSQYKEEYLVYKKKFFEEEAKKWQNMPLDTMADLRKQLDYLAEKEREEQSDPPKTSWDIPPFLHKKGCSYEGCSECSEDSKSSIITIADSLDKDFDESFLKEEIEKFEARICLEKLSSEIVASKLRQDSGYFEMNDTETASNCSGLLDISRADDIGIETTSGAENASQNPILTETNKDPEETDKSNETSDKIDNNKTPDETTDTSAQNKTDEAESDKTVETSEGNNTENVVSSSNQPSVETSVENNNAEAVGEEVISTSNQPSVETSVENNNPETVGEKVVLTSDEPSVETSVENNNAESVGENVVSTSNQTSNTIFPENAIQGNMNQSEENDDDDFDTRSIMSDHDYCRPESVNILNENSFNKRKSKQAADAMVPMSTKSRFIPKITKLKFAKENKVKDNALMGPPPPKRRKLSKKQIAILMTSKIVPVKEIKFEKFFSMNYQPQLGEGDVPSVDYESDEEVTPEEVLAPDEDVRSIISDHSYCHLPHVADDIDESGFVDGDLNESCQLPIESREDGEVDNPSQEELQSESPVPVENRPVDSEYQAEYERLLTQLKESRREFSDELEEDPDRVIIERQKKEQERLAAKARVEEWKNTINPILRNLKETDFNIHEYGAKVMEGMEVEDVKPFKTIVDGKTSAEVVRFNSQLCRGEPSGPISKYVCRYFIASLQLANTYNVEICGTKTGELSNDTFAIKLLKKDRYHEHLAEYHAPSEENLREKLKRIRKLQRQEEIDGETDERVVKRLHSDNSNKRKRQRDESHTTNTTAIRNDSQTPSISAPPNTTKTYKRSKSNSNYFPNPAKGKNIVKLPSFDSGIDINTPSTSQSAFIHSAPFNAESFCKELESAQNKNPELFSTPKTTHSNRDLGISVTKLKLSFDY